MSRGSESKDGAPANAGVAGSDAQSSEKAPQKENRKSRRARSLRQEFLLSFAIQGSVIGAIAYLLLIAVNPAIERAAITELQRLGITSVDLKVVAVDTEQLVVQTIQIGRERDLELSTLNVRFEWTDLLAGKIDRILLDGLRFRVLHEGDRISFGALDPLFRIMQEGASRDVDYRPERWPVQDIVLSNATLEFRLPTGPILIDLSGELSQDDDLAVTLNDAVFSSQTPQVGLTGRADAVLSPDGSARVDMDVARGYIRFPGADVSFADGSLNLTSNLDHPEVTDARARLRLSEASLPLGLRATGDLALTVKDGDAQVNFQIDEPDLTMTGDVDITFSNILSERRNIGFSSVVAVEDLGRLKALAPTLPVSAGQGRIELSFEEELRRLRRAGRESLAVGGAVDLPPVRIDLVFDTVQIDPLATPVSAAGAFDATFFERTVTLLPTRPFELIALESDALLPPAVAQFLPGASHELILATRPDDFLSLTVGETGAESDVRVGFSLRTSAGDALAGGAVQATLQRTLGPQESGIDPEVLLEEFWIEIPKRSFGGVEAAALIAAQGHASGPSFEGAIDTTVSLAGLRGSLGAPLDGVLATASLSVRGDGRRIEVAPVECLSFQLEDVRFDGPLRPISRADACLDIDRLGVNLPSSRAPHPEFDASMRLRFVPPTRDMLLGEHDVQGVVQTGRAALEFDGAVRVGETGPVLDAEAVLSGVRLILKQRDIALENIGAKVRWHGAPPRLPDEADVGVEWIRHVTSAPYFTPVRLAAGVSRTGKQLSISGHIDNPAVGLRIEVDAEHGLDSGRGKAVIRMPPIWIDGTRRGLDALSPFAATKVGNAAFTGMVAGDGTWSVADGTVEGDIDLLLQRLILGKFSPSLGTMLSAARFEAGQVAFNIKANRDAQATGMAVSGELLLDNAGGSIGGATLRGINGVVPVDDLFALRSEDAIEIAVAHVEAGLPLTNGVVRLELPGNGAPPGLKNLIFDLAEGKVGVTDIDVDVGTGTMTGRLEVGNVKLQPLLQQFGLAEVTSDGILDGNLPFAVGSEGFALHDGTLAARGGGFIAYRPGSPPEGELGMLFEVLQNFHYSELRMDLRETDDGLGATVFVKGANPDYLGGVPIELEINVSGDLAVIAQDSLGAYSIPEDIARRMRRFSQ